MRRAVLVLGLRAGPRAGRRAHHPGPRLRADADRRTATRSTARSPPPRSWRRSRATRSCVSWTSSTRAGGWPGTWATPRRSIWRRCAGSAPRPSTVARSPRSLARCAARLDGEPAQPTRGLPGRRDPALRAERGRGATPSCGSRSGCAPPRRWRASWRERAGVRAAEVGYAGRKDRDAVTTQWFSVQGLAPEAALALELPGLRVIEARRHPHKLRTGQLRGNRFEIVARDVGPEALRAAPARFERLQRDGMPNRFGPQRFGWDGGNLEQARRLLRGEKIGADRRHARFLLSALQAAAFNAVLARATPAAGRPRARRRRRGARVGGAVPGRGRRARGAARRGLRDQRDRPDLRHARAGAVGRCGGARARGVRGARCRPGEAAHRRPGSGCGAPGARCACGWKPRTRSPRPTRCGCASRCRREATPASRSRSCSDPRPGSGDTRPPAALS